MAGNVAGRKRARRPPFQKILLPNTIPLPPEGLNELKVFNYDSKGDLLLTKLTAAHSEFTGFTETLGMHCAIILLQAKPGKRSNNGEEHVGVVGRVSVVNEYGYCLYDRFVLPTAPVADYRTHSTGIRQEDLENATPREVVTGHLRKLLKGHQVVGLKLRKKLRLLKILHPKKMTHEIQSHTQLKTDTRKMGEYVKLAFGIDMQNETCSIKCAQGAVTLYKAFLEYGNHGAVLEKTGAAEHRPTFSGRFEYDPTGQLLTSLGPVDTEYYSGHSGVISFACTLVPIISKEHGDGVLARVSVVNEHGYCLYDKFVLHNKDVALPDGETVVGIRKDEFLKIAQPIGILKSQLSELIKKNHVVVGHGLEASLASLGIIVDPKKCLRDTDKFIRQNVLGLNCSVPLEVLVQKELNVHLESTHSTVVAAQVAMALYQKHKDGWEESLRDVGDQGINSIAAKPLNESNKSGMFVQATDAAHLSYKRNVKQTNSKTDTFQNSNDMVLQSSSSPDPIIHFEYDYFGWPLTPLNPENKGLCEKTEVVAVACALISVARNKRMLARVSVVNLFGYCLYDKLVKPPDKTKNKKAINYHTETTGIRKKDLEKGFPRSTVLEEIRAILKGRIVICHDWKQTLNVMLQYVHPAKQIRDTSIFVGDKLGLAKPADFATLVKEALINTDSTQEKICSSITDAQSLILLYRKYQREWEETTPKPNSTIIENNLESLNIADPPSETLSSKQSLNFVAESLPPEIEVDKDRESDNFAKAESALSFFKYDLLGYLVASDNIKTSAANEQLERTTTDIVALECEIVTVIFPLGRTFGLGEVLGRVSVVNEYGYLLYDSFVKPNEPVGHYTTPFSDIRKEHLDHEFSDLLSSALAPPYDHVVEYLKFLLEDRIVVGHSIFQKNVFELLPFLWNPMRVRVRDTSIYYEIGRGIGSPPLKDLVKTVFDKDVLREAHNPIEAAQAAMALYLLEKEKCDELFEMYYHYQQDQVGGCSGDINKFLASFGEWAAARSATKIHECK